MIDRVRTGFAHEVFAASSYPTGAARWVATNLPKSGSLVVTGGPAAEAVYPELTKERVRWDDFEVSRESATVGSTS